MTPPRRPEGPQRTCVGCRRTTDQSQLIRLVAGPSGVVADRFLGGRGAWICPMASCVDAALTKGALARALRLDRRSIDPEAVRALVPVVRPAQ